MMHIQDEILIFVVLLDQITVIFYFIVAFFPNEICIIKTLFSSFVSLPFSSNN